MKIISDNHLISLLNWKKNNHLMPVVIQDDKTHGVLMLGYMNETALKQTLETQKVTFYSRTKQRLWVKGETSGHYLHVKKIMVDCDQDSLLILATPEGPTCHTGQLSCFDYVPEPDQNNPLNKLEAIILDRYKNPSLNSYTSDLFCAGLPRMAQKVGEEAVETVLAAVCQSKQHLIAETSDLIFHLLVLLRACDVSLEEVLGELMARAKK